jgi:hypothetical protein
MVKKLISLLIFLFSSLSWAQNVYEHPPSHLLFPATLGNFQRMTVYPFEDPKLGVQVGYLAPGLGKADFYIFDYGFSDIAEGITSEQVRSAYGGADKDIHKFVESGLYRDFEQLVPLGSVLKQVNPALQWYVSAYKFTPNRENSEPLISWLLVTGYRHHFLKIRFSHTATQPREGRQAVDQLIEALMKANQAAEAAAL